MNIKVNLLFTTALAAASCGAAPALAQSAPPPPEYDNIDENGVDLTLGTFNFDLREGSIGSGPDELALTRYWRGRAWYDDWTTTVLWSSTGAGGQSVSVVIGPQNFNFTKTGAVFVPSKADGSSLEDLGGGTFRYRDSRGTSINFGRPAGSPTGARNMCGSQNAYSSCQVPPLSKTLPDGRTTSFNWQVTASQCPGSGCRADWLLSNVVNSAGFSMSFTWLPVQNHAAGWPYKNTVTFSGPNTGSTPPQVSYSYPDQNTMLVTDMGSRVWKLEHIYSTFPFSPLVKVRRPGATADNITVGYDETFGLTSVAHEGVTTNYSFSSDSINTSAVVSQAGTSKTVISSLSAGRPTSFTDELGRVTTIAYDSNRRPVEITRPEGDKAIHAYDPRGNVVSMTLKAKPGSGLADIVTSAIYPASCTNPVTCNLPTSTTDAKGNTTDHAYDASTGQVTSVILPTASAGAVRPQTRYNYGVTNGVSLLTSISSCGSQANCAGTGDEIKTDIAYHPDNLLPRTFTKGDGTGALSAVTGIGYDAVGNVTMIDGPLPGTADTARKIYNNAREVVGVIAPDPDGAGPRKHRAERYTRNLDGQVTVAAVGTTNGQSDADWAAFVQVQRATTVYDANARPIRQTVSAGSVDYAVRDVVHDALGRPSCAIDHMNPATWSTQATACAPLQTNGPHGPDRVARTLYDAAGQVTTVQTALGTPQASDEATSTWTGNGRLATLTDGEGNRTTYEYDGHDRLSKTRYPSPTTDGVSSTTDYEQPSYDANGNVIALRLRDGQSIANSYDALDRLVHVDLPNTAPFEGDKSFGYDLLGRLTGTSDAIATQLVMSYDALGRRTSEASAFYGTVGMQYDLAGRRTRLTWRDGFFVSYDYDTNGNMTAIRENGGALLASYGYDDLGRRTGITRGNGTTTAYAYDPVSRLSNLSENFTGTTHDQTLGFTYNPAGQIATNTRGNDLYAWNGHANQDKLETPNGLNQLTQQGATVLSHDARGNVSAIGSAGYGHTAENRLASAPGTQMYHDPLGRLVHLTGSGTDLLYAGVDHIQEVAAGAGPTRRRYVPGAGVDERVVWYEGAGTSDRRWLHADERGSIVAVSDASGAAIAINRYDDYGNPAATNLGKFGYTGQTWLPELGMWYYKARMYAPQLGRFMQSDPIGYGDGMNLYAYVGGDPVNLVDPAGLCREGDHSEPGEAKPCLDDTIIVTGTRIPSVLYDVSAFLQPPILISSGIPQLIGTADNTGGITEEGRPLTVADLGVTTGGVIVVEGYIKRRNNALVIAVGFLRSYSARGVITQSLANAVRTARRMNLRSVEIAAVFANDDLERVITAGRLTRGYPGTIITQHGVVTFIRIPVQ